ncbi:MAG: hypothetical protein JXA73_16175 [Acidobacteria bacterium]|nr:hypothetical protein [Acidobacteriota bacterium]
MQQDKACNGIEGILYVISSRVRAQKGVCQRSNERPEAKKTLCRPSPGCHCNCGLPVHVKDNKILAIKGNPVFSYNRGSVCERIS